MFRMSVAASAAALGSFDVTVWGPVELSLDMTLLVDTVREAGLPLRGGVGTGEARFGGAVGTPLDVAVDERESVAVTLTACTLTWPRAGETTCADQAVPAACSVEPV